MTALIVGVACLFSTLLIYSGTVISFLRFEHTLLFVGTFAETTLLAATLFGALFLGLSLAGKRLPSMLLGAGGGMLYLCCALAFAYFSWFGSLGTALLIALAVAAALGDVCLALTWGRICARFKIKRALVAVSLASMLSAGICFLYAVLPLPGVTVLFVLSSIAAVIVPLAFSGTADSTEQTAPERAEGRTTGATLASLADVVVAPGLGLLVFAFAMAVMRTAFNESQNAYLAALALDAATLLAYTTLRKKRFALRGGMHQTFLPLMAMVLLAATSISASVGGGSGLVSFLTYALYALAAILTLATLCAIANAGEFSADLVFSTAVLLFCAASFAGQSFASVLDDDLVHVAVTVTTTLYAFVMVLSSYMRRTRDAHDEQRAAEHAEDEAAPKLARPLRPAGGRAQPHGARAGNPRLPRRRPQRRLHLRRAVHLAEHGAHPHPQHLSQARRLLARGHPAPDEGLISVTPSRIRARRHRRPSSVPRSLLAENICCDFVKRGGIIIRAFTEALMLR